MPKVPKIRSLHIFVISPESIGDEVDFLPADKDKSFPEVFNNFTISLQYLKENRKDEVDFLPADKCQKFLQINTINLGVWGQACSKYPK